ncbi:hypothetical protein ACFE04_026186 [Oxalis oulophora]
MGAAELAIVGVILSLMFTSISCYSVTINQSECFWENVVGGSDSIHDSLHLPHNHNGKSSLKDLTRTDGEDVVLAMNSFIKLLLAVSNPTQMKQGKSLSGPVHQCNNVITFLMAKLRVSDPVIYGHPPSALVLVSRDKPSYCQRLRNAIKNKRFVMGNLCFLMG